MIINLILMDISILVDYKIVEITKLSIFQRKKEQK